jgi:M6 family metalloprotease-like protein
MLLPILFSSLAAQNREAFHCGMQEPAFSSLAKSIEPHSGAHLPTHGNIRGRVIFVQAQNDAVVHHDWPLGGMPVWANAYAERVQRYFSDMSHGELQLKLDVHPDAMITRSREDDYVYWQRNFGDAIKEILDSLDQSIDFSEYDLWDSEGKPYRVQAGPDGKVDLLIFIFRSIANTTFLPFSGVSDLGFEGYHFLDGSLGRWVYGGTGQFNDASSSGITICRSPGYRMVIEEEFAFQVTIHEFGHKLFGEGHPAELYGGLGVMANAGNGYAMNSFERHLAGYIDYAETHPGVDTTVVLRDYVTRGEALLIPLPSLPRGYYSLEFRARHSEWDSAPVPGLYAFRVYDSWSRNQKEVELISAEGKFEWALDSATNNIFPVRSSPLKGYSRFQRIPLSGKTYWADGWWGDPRSAFTLERPYFSVLKNPSPDFMNGADTVRTGLHITLLAIDDSTATVRISYQTPVILDVRALTERGFAMAPPYPHPLRLNEAGTIPLRINTGGNLRLRLHDALGRQQRVLHDGRVEAGNLLLSFSTDGLPAGMYTIVMETDKGSSTSSVMIAR